MRVLHIISNLMSGGAESMLTKIVEQTPQIEHHVISFIAGGVFAERLSACGVPVHDFGLKRGQAARALFELGRLRSSVWDISPDVIQGWMYHGNVAASASACGRPVIWNVRQGLEKLSDNSLSTRAAILGSLLFRRSVRAIIYNSHKSVAEHRAVGYPQDRAVLIPNGFDIDAFAPNDTLRAALRAEIGVDSATPLIGRVARYDDIKDTPTLLRAFSKMPQRTARLLLVGRGMDSGNPELARLVNGLELRERVILLGERTDIARINCGLDLAVLSSSHGEAFPNALGEAMACATPVVATDVGECGNIVGDPDRLSPPGDPDRLAQAMSRILSLPGVERRILGRRDRTRVSEQFELTDVASRYCALWKQVATTA